MNEPLFIWDFVADTILGQIVDWIYGQVMGFLGNFFAEMGNMGVELFELSWVQSIVLFFSYPLKSQLFLKACCWHANCLICSSNPVSLEKTFNPGRASPWGRRTAEAPQTW